MRECLIKDICSKASSNLKQKDVEGKDGLYPVYGASGIISRIDTYHQENEYIAIVKDGSGIGRVSFMPPLSSVIGTMQYILPKKGFDIKYIGYCLQGLDLSKYKQGAAIPHIYFRDYGERTVKVEEDFEAQQRIVAYLDSSFAKIDEMKANAAKALSEAKALFQAELKKCMEKKDGWEEKRLKDCTSAIGDGLHGTPKYTETGDYYFVNGNNLENGKIEIKADTKKVDEEEYRKYKNDLNENTVLLSINGTVGKTAFYDSEKIVLGKSACYINVLPLLRKDYLRYYLMSNHFYDYVNKNARQATIKNLGLKEIRGMFIPIPPLSIQHSIVTHLDTLSKKVQELERNYNTILAECDALKQAILRETFE